MANRWLVDVLRTCQALAPAVVPRLATDVPVYLQAAVLPPRHSVFIDDYGRVTVLLSLPGGWFPFVLLGADFDRAPDVMAADIVAACRPKSDEACKQNGWYDPDLGPSMPLPRNLQLTLFNMGEACKAVDAELENHL